MEVQYQLNGQYAMRMVCVLLWVLLPLSIRRKTLWVS